MPELSQHTYRLPLPQNASIERVVSDSPAHTGAFKGAVDFAVPLYTDVLAPLSGEVAEVVDGHDKYGDSIQFADYVNYVRIDHGNREFSELLHLDKGSVVVRPQERVRAGQVLGKTGLSGWMTAPHLHWFVYRTMSPWPGFVGLAIRLDEYSIERLQATQNS